MQKRCRDDSQRIRVLHTNCPSGCVEPADMLSTIASKCAATVPLHKQAICGIEVIPDR